MAEVRVFVDDAVRGALPRVCVMSGQPATERFVMRKELHGKGLGIGWLLVLFGPPG